VPGPALSEPGRGDVAPVSGFYGKIPSRGDFVRAGLPRSFTDPWDDWLAQVIAGSRDLLGAEWLPAWMEAPIWHFALPAGQCGPAAVLGVWMPSVDAAGRHFPLTLARIGPPPADPGAWLAGAEAAGLLALQDDLSPGDLGAHLNLAMPGAAAPDLPPDGAPPDSAAPDGAALWWTEGSPFVPPTRLATHALPDAAMFAAMLHAVPGSTPLDQPDNPPPAEGVRE